MRSDAGSVCIRAMAEGDVDRVAAIAASLGTAPQWARSSYTAAIAPGGIPRRIALVAEVGGEVAGFVVASVVVPQAELESIVVAAAAQGQGIGAVLLAALMGELRLSRVAEVSLELRESNRMAGRLYERAGFREVGRRRGYYREPEEDAVLLRLPI